MPTPLLFYFKSLDSPTQYNLHHTLLKMGAEPTSKANWANFSDKNLSLDDNICQLLEYKHKLATVVTELSPQVMPTTLLVNDDNYYDTIKDIDISPENPWILKPSLLNNGHGITIFDQKETLLQHYGGGERYGGWHVLQQYITSPHLLDKRKYTIRLFVVVTNLEKHYLYRHGYVNICRKNYIADDINDLSTHLSNEHLSTNKQSNSYQWPTTRVAHFEDVYPNLQRITQTVLHAFNDASREIKADETTPAFSLFGFDFLLDENLRPWLLEANHCPCFPKDKHHPLIPHLYQQFWRDIVEATVKPIAEGKLSNFGQGTNFQACQ